MRSVSRVPPDPVGFWLGRLDSVTAKVHLSYFNRFMSWLRRQPSWEFASPRDLLIRQIQAEDPYVLLDLVQSYVSSLRCRKATKDRAYSVVRSFFLHNRCALPQDRAFRIHGDQPPVTPRLTVENIIELYHAANLCYKSAIIVKWQGFLDNARLIYVGQHLTEQIVTQIQEGVQPVRLDLPGRKANKYDREGTFYTFIGKDAVDALVKYFEEERGWPKPSEPIWLIKSRRALTKSAFEITWLRLLRRLGRIPMRQGHYGSRYGYNPHEMRDVAISLCHTQAKKLGFDMDSAKFFAGQVGQVDPLKYDKFYEDSSYVRDQYLIAETCLNIISMKPTARSPEEEKRTQKLEQDVAALQRDIAELSDKIAKSSS